MRVGEINPEPIKNYTIDDREYSLHTFNCPDCQEEGYRIYRITGIQSSCFILPSNFDPCQFEGLCVEIDEDLLQCAADLVMDFYQDLNKVNSASGIHIDGTYSSRLLEYGRTRVIRLRKLDAFDALISKDKPNCSFAVALQSAFEFGFAAGQYAATKHSEDLFWEGVFARKAREEGQARARDALIKKGQKTRQIVIKAAQAVYAANPELMRNDAAAARAVQKLDWPDLRPNGKILSQDSITKHLRETRKRNCPKNLHENPDFGKSSR